jgi:hypothetical protein
MASSFDFCGVADGTKRVRVRMVPAFVNALQEPSGPAPLVRSVPVTTEKRRREMLLRTLSAAIVTAVVTSAPGFAQTGQAEPPPRDCLAMPRTDEQTSPQGVDPQTTQSLTEKLDSCDGVLLPPSVGDQELTQPPPDTGEMRVIKPRDLPGQQTNPQ